MSSAHESGNILNLRKQKALGTEFLFFADAANNKLFMVDLQSLNIPNTAPPTIVNTEINAKKIEVLGTVAGKFQLTETAGDNNLLAVAWTEEKTPGTSYSVTLVAITKDPASPNGYKFVKCPNASHDIPASEVPELTIFIKDNEPKILNIVRRGDQFSVEAFGH